MRPPASTYSLPPNILGNRCFSAKLARGGAVRATERRWLDQDTVDALLHRHRERSVQILDGLHRCRMQLNTELIAGTFRGLQESTVPRRRRAPEHGEARGIWHGLLQYLQRLDSEVRTQTGQTCNVPAWPREACH